MSDKLKVSMMFCATSLIAEGAYNIAGALVISILFYYSHYKGDSDDA